MRSLWKYVFANSMDFRSLPAAHSEFESLELLLEASKVPDDELPVAGRGGELVRPVLVARHDLDGTAEGTQQSQSCITFSFRNEQPRTMQIEKLERGVITLPLKKLK